MQKTMVLYSTSNKKALLAMVAAATLGIGQFASAAPIVTGSTSNTGFTVSSTDLLEGKTPTAISGTQDQEGLGSDTTGSVLTDGGFGDPGLGGTPNTYLTIVNNGASITYSFSTPVNITEIDTYTGWRDGGRVNQDYIIVNGVTPVATVNFDPGNSLDTKVAVTDSTGTLATGVSTITFNFPSTQNGYVGYREIDVFGSVVPEPASLGLLGVGALGLMARRRKA